MSTYLSLHYHVVFSTKNRVPCLAGEWRNELHSYMSGTIKGLGGYPQRSNGWTDHVHLLFGLKATHNVSDVVRELKKASTSWLQNEGLVPNFHWQNGYAAFTVGHRERDVVKAYIDKQAEHHGRATFKDELISLLQDHGVEYDPKYLL